MRRDHEMPYGTPGGYLEKQQEAAGNPSNPSGSGHKLIHLLLMLQFLQLIISILVHYLLLIPSVLSSTENVYLKQHRGTYKLEFPSGGH